MRIVFFLFGLALGSLLLVFFLKKKGTTFNYFPNERVLSQLKEKELSYAPNIAESDTALCREIISRGEVIFSQSILHQGKCNEYKISLPDQERTFIRVDFCDSTALIKALSKEAALE